MPQIPPTARIDRILSTARSIAWQQFHGSIDTGHVLLALLGEDTCCAARILLSSNVTSWRLRSALTRRAKCIEFVSPAELSPTKTLRNVVHQAVDDARELNHPRIAAEHLLLALLQYPEACAMAALRKLGVEALDVCRKLLHLLADDPVFLVKNTTT